MNIKDRVKQLEDSGMRCNCDLDKWEPEHLTGHSWVCRIHKAATSKLNKELDFYETDEWRIGRMS